MTDYYHWLEFVCISERLGNCYCYHLCNSECHEIDDDDITHCQCHREHKEAKFPQLTKAIEQSWIFRMQNEKAHNVEKMASEMYEKAKKNAEKSERIYSQYNTNDYIDSEEIECIKKRKIEQNKFVSNTNVYWF